MESIEKTGENSELLLTGTVQIGGGKTEVDITKERLDWVVGIERNNIEENEEFFMQNFERFDKILDTEYLIRINKKLAPGVSYDIHSSSLIREQEGEVIVPGLTPEEALIWGVKVINFVRTGINAGDVRHIEGFSKSFKEIYERRLSQLRFDHFELERGIFTGGLGDFLKFSLKPSEEPQFRRYEFEIINPETSLSDSLLLEPERYYIFLSKYGLIFELIMKCAELQVKGASAYRHYKEGRWIEALRVEKANLLATFDDFLEE